MACMGSMPRPPRPDGRLTAQVPFCRPQVALVSPLFSWLHGVACPGLGCVYTPCGVPQEQVLTICPSGHVQAITSVHLVLGFFLPLAVIGVVESSARLNFLHATLVQKLSTQQRTEAATTPFNGVTAHSEPGRGERASRGHPEMPAAAAQQLYAALRGVRDWITAAYLLWGLGALAILALWENIAEPMSQALLDLHRADGMISAILVYLDG
jgi:hypothetical protein